MAFKEEYFGQNKERRKRYYRARSVSYRCRNHGDCPICTLNRLHKAKLSEFAAQQDLEDWLYGEEQWPYMD